MFLVTTIFAVLCITAIFVLLNKDEKKLKAIIANTQDPVVRQLKQQQYAEYLTETSFAKKAMLKKAIEA